ncbi:MAG: efflux RND transporter periplasmic adaptor subunit [Terriglobales bacterium]
MERLHLNFLRASAGLLAGLLLVGCSSTQPDAPQPEVTVQVAVVRRGALQHIVRTEAVLFPLHQAILTPKISAPVARFLVQRGSPVQRGQLLAVLENRDLQAARIESQGALEQAQASYQTTTTATLPEDVQKAEFAAKVADQDLQVEEKLFNSRESLFKQGALPRKDLDQARILLVQAQSQAAQAHQHLKALLATGRASTLKSAAGQLQAARGRFLGTTAALSYTEVRSPIDGVVTDRPLYPGELATPSAPLMTVMDLSRVVARAHIPQTEAALLQRGNPATLSSAAGNVSGTVTLISPALDPNSTTVEVWVEAPNPGGRLRPGSSVQVVITAATVPDTLIIPESALLTTPEGATSVMVVASDQGRTIAEERPVKIGFRSAGDAQVVQGLTAGERIVSVGAYGLPNKSQIKIQ